MGMVAQGLKRLYRAMGRGLLRSRGECGATLVEHALAVALVSGIVAAIALPRLAESILKPMCEVGLPIKAGEADEIDVTLSNLGGTNFVRVGSNLVCYTLYSPATWNVELGFSVPSRVN